MATYVRLRDIGTFRRTLEEHACSRFLTQRNPYKKKTLSDTLNEDATPWQIWFEAVDATYHKALKKKVPTDFHDLIDGREICPDCGAVLGYQPGRTREYMVERCEACGRLWEVLASAESERAKKWSEWQVAHGEPRTLSEFWVMQAEKREKEAAAREGEARGESTSS